MRRDTFLIPGTECELVTERDDALSVRRISVAGRAYLSVDADDTHVVDGGFVTWRPFAAPHGFIRRVTAPHATWTEDYEWDEHGRVSMVDGVAIERDPDGRVTACTSDSGTWRYQHVDNRLISVDSVAGSRWIGRGAAGRPTAWRRDGYSYEIGYDDRGRRVDQPSAPSTWRFDELGRLWTILDEDGAVRHTFLWADLDCFARIDGPPGHPIAVAFMLDPTGTPVRIVSADGARRVPRDAYGESLLREHLVPGLFGGACFGGFFHYRARCLDPLTGSYGGPDPFDGSPDDPRRRAQQTGPLVVETGAGPYACCQHDPISRIDPTGEMSFSIGGAAMYGLSRLTWSYRLTLFNWIGLRAFAQLWMSLFRWKLGRWAWCEPIKSSRSGRWGFIVDKAGLDSAFRLFTKDERQFTIGDVFWTSKEHMERVRAVSVFVPSAAFAPTLYGSQLRAAPSGKQPPFLLSNKAGHQMSHAWTRTGGEAKAVAPGLPEYYFPDGAIHFAISMSDDFGNHDDDARRGPFDGDMQEVKPEGQLVPGTVQEKEALLFDGERELSGGTTLYLEQSGSSDIAVVDGYRHRRDKTVVRLRTPPGSTISRSYGVDARVLGKSASTQVKRAVLATNDAVDVAGLPEYKPKQVIKLTDPRANPASTIHTRIKELRATIDLDRAFAPGGKNIKLFTASRLNQDKHSNKDLRSVEIDPAKPDQVIFKVVAGGPNIGDLIGIYDPKKTGDADLFLVRVTGFDQTNKKIRIVDRQVPLPPPPSTPPIPNVVRNWAKLVKKTELGTIVHPVPSGLNAATNLRYEPNKSGTVPATGFVVIATPKVGSTAATTEPRRVTARVDDAIVVEPTGATFLGGLPPATPPPVTVDVERFENRDVHKNVSWENLQYFVPNVAGPLPGDFADIIQIQGSPTLTAGSPAFDGDLNGDVVTVKIATIRLSAASVGDIVVVGAGANLDARILDELLFTFTLDRPLPFAADIRAVAIEPTPPRWVADRIDDRTLLVSENVDTAVGSGPPALQSGWLPRFKVGELIQVVGATTENYRIESVVEGTMLKISTSVPVLPAAISGQLRIMRMAVVDSARNNGSPYSLIDGKQGSAGATQVVGRIWHPRGILANSAYAFTDGTTTFPATVTRIDSGEAKLLPATAPTVAAGPVTVSVHSAIKRATVAKVENQPTQVDLDVEGIEPDHSTSCQAGTDLTFYRVLEHRKSDASVAGSFKPPSVYCPVDVERYEFSRRDAIIEHELTHTEQCAKRGPFLLSPVWGLWPWVMQSIGHADSVGLEERYTDYRPCTIGSTGAVDWVQVANPADLEPGRPVQLAQGDRLIDVVLGAQVETDRFQVQFGAVALSAGDARIRALLARGDFERDVSWVAAVVNSLASIGGLVSLTAANWYGAFGYFIRRAFDIYEQLPARIPEGRTRSLVSADGSRLDLQKYDLIRVVNGNDHCYVSVIGINEVDNSVDLDGSITPAAADRSVTYAKLLHEDRLERLDIGTRFVGDWLSTLIDPWQRFELDHFDSAGTSGKVLLKAMSLAFGTRSWFDWPFWGYFWKDNGRRNAKGKGHLSQMEQRASEQSGDLYSAMATLRDRPKLVGDIGRYWQFAEDRWGSTLEFSRGERVGHQGNFPGRVLLVNDKIVPTPSPLNEPNRDIESQSSPDEGIRLPEAFFDKRSPTPLAPMLTNPSGFQFSTQARIPARRKKEHSQTLHRSDGYYVAFSGPTPPGKMDRVTVPNDGYFDDIGEAQAAGVQKIFHDLSVADVKVTCAGLEVERKQQLGTYAQIELVQTQRAMVRVQPGGARKYALMMKKPVSDPTVHVDGVELVAQNVNGTALVEVSRKHTWDPARQTFDSPSLNHHGVHLPDDIHIPVRQFEVNVVDTLAFRETASRDGKKLTAADKIEPGKSVYLLIPTNVIKLTPGPVTYTVTPPAPNENPIVTFPSLTGAERNRERDFLGGDGRLYKMTVDPKHPPEDECEITYQIEVGTPGNTPPPVLTAVLRMKPHFRLTVVGGGPPVVAPGADLTLEVPAADNVTLTTDAKPIVEQLPQVTAKIDANGKLVVHVPATAAPGIGRVLVRDPANHAHMAQRAIQVKP